jgi:hypothetical protein
MPVFQDELRQVRWTRQKPRQQHNAWAQIAQDVLRRRIDGLAEICRIRCEEMKCPYCDALMERGYVAAGTTSIKGMTRLEWFGQKPRFVSTGGVPLTKFDAPGCVSAYRCKDCRAVLATY